MPITQPTADALARLDDGEERPGDRQLAEQYEAYCQASYDAYMQAIAERERAEWEAQLCPVCGELCDECPTGEPDPLPLPYAA